MPLEYVFCYLLLYFVYGERDNDISRRSMDRKTKECKESCNCVALSLKKIKVSCHKRTIIP